MKNNKIKKLVLAAMFLSLGFVLPLFTGQIKEIGDTLLPMHLPVLLCGFFSGSWFGFGVGLILPFLRSAVFSMPPIYPQAVWMALELATYGLVVGLIYPRFKKKNLLSIYISLVSAMITGRVVWGITKWVLLTAANKSFTFSLFIAGGFVDALPGIIIQLILIPIIVSLLDKRRKI